MKSIFNLIIFLIPCFIQIIAIKEFNFKISEIHELIDSEGYNCSDIINYFLQRAYYYGPKLSAIINYNPNSIIEAISLDEFYYSNNKKKIGVLHCVPVLVKDNVDVKAMSTTCGVKALRNSVPQVNSDVILKLKNEGAIVIAKANLFEFAGAITNSELGGECRNPWDQTKACGGTSSGTAAGIAAGLAVIGVGTDTSGSIMTPAGLCGVYGLRPSFNEISTYGVFPASERHDTIGPLTRYIDDLILVNNIISKSSVNMDSIQPNKIKIGYFKNFFQEIHINSVYGNYTYDLDDQIVDNLIKSIKNMRDLKIEVVEIDLNSTQLTQMVLSIADLIFSAFSQCIPLCFKYSIDKYFNDSIKFEVDSPYKSFDDLAESSLLSEYWIKNFNMTNIQNAEATCEYSCMLHDEQRVQFTQLLETYYISNNIKALIFPTNNNLPADLNDTEFKINLSPIYFPPITGYASLTIPIGFSKPTKTATNGLPIGMMIMSKQEHLDTIFTIAKLYDEKYLTQKTLPPFAPQLNQNICQILSNNSLRIKFNLSFTFIIILIYYFLKVL